MTPMMTFSVPAPAPSAEEAEADTEAWSCSSSWVLILWWPMETQERRDLFINMEWRGKKKERVIVELVCQGFKRK